MNFRTFSEIIQLNKEFYKKVGESFSDTRQSPWGGWYKVDKVIKEHFAADNEINILDLGCGNGRYFKFLLEDSNIKNLKYLGVDTSGYLLNLAYQAHYDVKSFEFKQLDIIQNLDQINGNFDFICAFGLTHHIPSSEFRKKWFSDVLKKLKPGGIFVFTTWNYDRDKRFDKVVKNPPADRINPDELETGDYFIGWDKDDSAIRYVHIYSNEEIQSIINLPDITLLDRFSADGKNSNLNDYFILKKN